MGDYEHEDEVEAPEEEVSPIGEWLRRKRLRRGWSQLELSAASGVSQGQISNLEVGKNRNPQPRTRERLEGALGVAVPEGLTREQSVRRRSSILERSSTLTLTSQPIFLANPVYTCSTTSQVDRSTLARPL
jgi:transcriptional regulator with XRE-family HTH domain